MIFDIVVTRNCNLNCKYCFEKTKVNEDMSVENIPKLIFFIKKYVNHDYVINKEEIIVNFNGGEPLLNFRFIKLFIEKTHTFVKRYSISTNLSFVNKEILNFLNNYNVTMHVSIDGCKKTNDMNRIDMFGKSYYKTLINNLKLLKTYKNISISLSMVYTPDTVCRLFYNVKYLYKKGFYIINASYASNYVWGANAKRIIEKQYRKISKLYIHGYQKKKNFYFSIFSDKIRSILSKASGEICGAFINEITLLPNGSFIPCLGFMGNELTENFVCGNWQEETNNNLNRISEFKDRVDKIKNNCKDCLLTEVCHKSCVLEILRAKNVKESVSAMNCITNQISYFECERIISKLLRKNNKRFVSEYKELINKIEVVK